MIVNCFASVQEKKEASRRLEISGEGVDGWIVKNLRA